jgi:NAD-reducing hydrogenase small subunit
MNKVKVATLWLDGCSGCHMSLLDIDERLIEVARHVEFVYTPLVDQKEFPEDVDVTLIEGAVGYYEDIEKLKKIRACTKILISLGDCAVAGNVPTMRNQFTVDDVLEEVFVDGATSRGQIPRESLPRLLPQVRPLHEVVPVDLFVQGCPPSADIIYFVLSELLEGRTPDLAARTRPGA